MQTLRAGKVKEKAQNVLHARGPDNLGTLHFGQNDLAEKVTQKVQKVHAAREMMTLEPNRGQRDFGSGLI